MSNDQRNNGKSSSLLWLWLLLGISAVVLIGVLACAGIGALFWLKLSSTSAPPAVESAAPVEPPEVQRRNPSTSKGKGSATGAKEELKNP